MIYYKNTNNEIFAEPIQEMIDKLGLVEITNPIREDGTILPSHYAISTLAVDIDGNLYKYYNVDGTADTVKIQAEIDLEAYNVYKQNRTEAVSNITVDVDGMIFDGDETSQTRMVRAIQTLIGDEPIQWILNDNTVVTITQTELGRALRLAGIAQTTIWTGVNV